MVPSIEVTDVKDGPPFAAGADWVVERTTTLLPFCNYYSPVGSYSLRSYSLDPFTKGERVVLCHANAQGLSEPVAPYAGSCPPKRAVGIYEDVDRLDKSATINRRSRTPILT